MWSVNVMYLLLLCYACLSVGNGEVYFVSKNFHNVLIWDPVNSDQDEVYSVQYLHYNDEGQFRIKEDCQNIRTLSCDLTAETPSVDQEYYFARVMSKGRSIGITTKFHPFRDTILGPATLSTHITASVLHINVTLPLGPKGVSLQDIINSSKSRGSKMEYILNITQPTLHAQELKNKTGQFNIEMMPNLGSYCGHVVYKPIPGWGREPSEKAFFCVKLQDNPVTHSSQLLVSVAVVAGIVIVSVVCVCTYLKGGKSKTLPQALKIPSEAHEVLLQVPDKNLIISEILVGTKSDQTVGAPIQVKPESCPGLFETYSPQDIPWHIFRGDSSLSRGRGTSNLEGASVHSSETYSAIATHLQVEDNEEPQAVTKCRRTSRSPLSSIEDENWNKENSSGDSVFQMHHERKPFLMDATEGLDVSLLMSLQRSCSTDSGCDDCTVNTPTSSYYNTSFSPPQTVVPYLHEGCHTIPSAETGSGYKQNWMPGISRKPALVDAWICSEMIKEVEDNEVNEDREYVANMGQIILGNWEIQTQK
nr:interferon lambda receptor 1 [Nothobranchius furzeri]